MSSTNTVIAIAMTASLKISGRSLPVSNFTARPRGRSPRATRRAPSRRRSRSRLADARGRSSTGEDDDGDLPVGLGLVLVVRGPDAGHHRPPSPLLVHRGGPGRGVEAVRSTQTADPRGGPQLAVPERVVVATAARGHHQVVLAVLSVDQRVASRLARASTGRGQHQRGYPVPEMPVGAVALDVAPG